MHLLLPTIRILVIMQGAFGYVMNLQLHISIFVMLAYIPATYLIVNRIIIASMLVSTIRISAAVSELDMSSGHPYNNQTDSIASYLSNVLFLKSASFSSS